MKIKQHITEEQLNELDFEAKGLLFRFFFPKLVNKQDYFGSKWMVYDINNEYLTIGRLIEFLDEYFSKEKRDFDIKIHSAGTGWHKPGERLVDIPSIITSEIEDEVELCDALWEACKQVLNKHADKRTTS